ncbi:MAG TPA: polysaccharide deacetylase family protein [Bacteroidia bacterium]|nr:polysaccharide deacetylase family protein [Bacteroidia bacterium]
MNILTIDLEDWFHILDHPETERPEQWSAFESRLESNVDRLLDILDEHKQQATWFCLGWIAKQYPSVVKKIAAKHEIACHSDVHQLVFRQSPAAFREDTRNVIKRLEDLCGKKMDAYRASGFSITEKTSWAFEILLECGITMDCSVFPANRNHGGFERFGIAQPCRISVQGAFLKEFPLNTVSLFGKEIVFSGGGYFRALPYSFIHKQMIRSDYVMTYFHPRDFDPDQPVMRSLPVKRRLMSYYGLKAALPKFIRLLNDHVFVDLSRAEKQVNWEKTPVVHL